MISFDKSLDSIEIDVIIRLLFRNFHVKTKKKFGKTQVAINRFLAKNLYILTVYTIIKIDLWDLNHSIKYIINLQFVAHVSINVISSNVSLLVGQIRLPSGPR